MQGEEKKTHIFNATKVPQCTLLAPEFLQSTVKSAQSTRLSKTSFKKCPPLAVVASEKCTGLVKNTAHSNKYITNATAKVQRGTCKSAQKLLSVNKLGLLIYTSHNYCKKKKKKNTLQVVGSMTSNMWEPGRAGKRYNSAIGAHCRLLWQCR